MSKKIGHLNRKPVELRKCCCGCGEIAKRYFNTRGENKGWRLYASGHAPNEKLQFRIPGDPIALAYFAGIIDGEGCVWADARLRDNSFHTVIVLRVTMCSSAVIEWIGNHFGGEVFVTAPPSANSQQRFHWQVRGSGVPVILRSILPYLIEKKKRAEIGIQLADMIVVGRRQKLSDEEIKTRISLASQIKAYNQNLRSEDTVQ